jgi:hypothetical protein
VATRPAEVNGLGFSHEHWPKPARGSRCGIAAFLPKWSPAIRRAGTDRRSPGSEPPPVHSPPDYVSAFRPDGSLKPDWLARLERLLRAADQRRSIDAGSALPNTWKNGASDVGTDQDRERYRVKVDPAHRCGKTGPSPPAPDLIRPQASSRC